jgi:hypothetical protein
MTYDSNQWVLFDDAESFQAKLGYQYSRCLKGLMIWDLGLDTANYEALTGLFGQEAVSGGLRDSTLNPNEEKKLAFDLSAYTGQHCYITDACTDGKSNNKNATCKAGYSSDGVDHTLRTQMNLTCMLEAVIMVYTITFAIQQKQWPRTASGLVLQNATCLTVMANAGVLNLE